MCFSSLLSANISIEVKQDKEKLFIDEILTVEIILHYPPETPPELFSFLYGINNAPPDFFEVVSSSVDDKKQKCTFKLQPTNIGPLYFTPGVIVFGNQAILVPGISVECLSTEISSLPFAGMLPLYPEKRINLSPANRVKLATPERLLRERERNLSSFDRYKTAWDAVAILLVSIPSFLLLLWALVHYELLQRELRPHPHPPLPQDVLWKEIRSNTLPLKERFHKLMELIRLTMGLPEQQALLGNITTIEAVCYAGHIPTEEEWQQALNAVQKLLHR